ncbi:MAG: phosphatidylglycerol lysyltransferase domain-containing protein [Desulfuromonadales bacterium]
MEIPPYPASRPLKMADKPLLDRLFTELQPRISELTFAGLYLFRKAHEYQLTTAASSVIVLGTGYDGLKYFLPPLGGNIQDALNIMFANGQSMYGADEPFLDHFLTNEPIDLKNLRDSSDYLYLREDLAKLPGSRFHKKKNRISYFTTRHDFTVEIYSTTGHHSDCLRLLDNWLLNSREEATRSLLMEVQATSEALNNAEELGLAGVVVIMNDHVAAFSLGERLNRDTAVCHFEKADPFTEGLYQLVNREFAHLLFQECIYVNREQDLGEMGLRSAKLSYHPVELINKYLVKRPDNKDFVALL